MTEPVTGAEYLARSLAANGTSHVFFIDAVLRRTLIELGTLGVQRVLGHSEKAVAYMADGYARIAGKPGVCFAQSVGAANLASGLQDAYLGRVPVIAMTGHKQPSMQHRNAYQEIPHQPMFSAVTKFSARVDAASDLPRLMRQAWREAMTGTPRPAHLDLNGLQAEVIEAGMVNEAPVVDPAFQLTIPPHRPTPSDDDIQRAATALLACPKICIVAGEGAMASKAGPELLAVAALLGAPIATSLGARGIVPTRHRLSVGCSGNYAAPPTNKIVHAAELVFFVGCDTGDQTTHTWRIPAIDTKCVQIDLDPTELGRSYANTLGIMGDPKATLAKLAAALAGAKRDGAFADWAAGTMAACRAGAGAGQQRGRHLARPPVRRDHGRIAARRHPGRRYWLFLHLDQLAGGTKRRGPDIPSRCRVAGLVVPRRAGGQVRGATSEGDLLDWRRGAVLPPDRTGNRQAAWHRGGAGGQQQFRIRAGLAEYPAATRQQTRRRAGTGAVRADQFLGCGGGVRVAGDPGRGPVAARAGAEGSVGVG